MEARWEILSTCWEAWWGPAMEGWEKKRKWSKFLCGGSIGHSPSGPLSKKGNQSTSGEIKVKSSYIRGEKREIQVHLGRKKGNRVTSGEVTVRYTNQCRFFEKTAMTMMRKSIMAGSTTREGMNHSSNDVKSPIVPQRTAERRNRLSGIKMQLAGTGNQLRCYQLQLT